MKSSLFLSLLLTGVLGAAPPTSETNERLREYLEMFPEGDTDQDGILTAAEALKLMAQQKAAAESAQQSDKTSAPTYANVRYGDHEQQVFDLWLAEPTGSGESTPLCIYFHGGGFLGGDKTNITEKRIKPLLDRGISVASMNYRLTEGGKNPYPVAMRDAARGLQTIRARAAEWRIDPEKIACFGGSAGAGISLWLAFHDDLADSDSADPIARQSTRIVAAATFDGQPTYDIRTFREWFGIENLNLQSVMEPLYAMKEGETAESPRVVALAEDASPITHLTADDPPVYQAYRFPNEPVTGETGSMTWVHHPLLGLKLQEKMRSLGLECVVTAPGIEDDSYADFAAFLADKLRPGPPAE